MHTTNIHNYVHIYNKIVIKHENFKNIDTY